MRFIPLAITRVYVEKIWEMDTVTILPLPCAEWRQNYEPEVTEVNGNRIDLLQIVAVPYRTIRNPSPEDQTQLL